MSLDQDRVLHQGFHILWLYADVAKAEGPRPHQNVGGGEKSSCTGQWGGQWKMASYELLTDLLSSHVSDGIGRFWPRIW